MGARHWLAVAARPDIVWRSTAVAVVVGTLLVVINQFEKIIALEIGSAELVKIALTYLVPYCVSTYASVMNTLHDHGSSTRS